MALSSTSSGGASASAAAVSRSSALSSSGSGSWSNPGYTGVSGRGSYGSGSDLMAQLKALQQANNTWSAQQAANQMAFQQSSAREAMKFNHDEAELNRKWQEYMSNTAHQREIKDLQAAGLNPVLSVMGGNGAPVTSGATASGYASQGAKGDTDTSISGALASVFGTMLQTQTQLASTAMSARSNEAIADKYNAMSKYTAELQASTQLSTANIQAMATRYSADRHADATKVAASISAAAMKYGYDLNAMTQTDLAAFNAAVNKDLQEAGFDHDFDVKKALPSTFWQYVSSGIGDLLGTDGILGATKSLYGKYATAGKAVASAVGKGVSALAQIGKSSHASAKSEARSQFGK